MPPKVKVTKDEIIKTALSLCREMGASAINARSVAAALGCSTQPIFSNFKSISELCEEVAAHAFNEYLSFLDSEAKSGEYPEYKAYGMAYIRFAKEEKNLFKLLFMCDRSKEKTTPTSDFLASVQLIMAQNGVDERTAELIHLEVWACVHGIATMLNTSFLDLDRAFISDMLTDVYLGVKKRHLEK